MLGPMLRRRIAVVTVAAAVGLGVYVGPAEGFHAGAPLDCGSAGTFTLRATQTGAAPGFEVPLPANVLLFEEGGGLTVFKFVRNGVVVFDKNATARANNAIDEVTCTFAFTEFGVVHVVEVTGILKPQSSR